MDALDESPERAADRVGGGSVDLAGAQDQPLALSRRVLVLWRAGWLLVTTLVAAVAALLALASDAGGFRPYLPALVLALVGGALALVVPAVAFRRWRYWVTPDGVEIRHGLLVRVESSIPHFRVQHIDLRQGPLQRLLGVVQLQISTASPSSDAELPGVTSDQAALVRQLVLARAEADDAV